MDTEETMFVDFMISDNGSDYQGPRKTPFVKDCCFGILDEDPFWFKLYHDEDLDYSLVPPFINLAVQLYLKQVWKMIHSSH